MLNDLKFNSILVQKILDKIKSESDDNNLYLQEYPHRNENYDLPFCLRLSTTIFGKVIESWGYGYNRDEAAFKATAELVERLSYINSSPLYYQSLGGGCSKLTVSDISSKYPNATNWMNLNTNGTSIHSNIDSAVYNSLKELIERHVIIKACALGVSGKEIESSKYLKNYKIPSDISIRFFLWKGPLEFYVCAGMVDLQGKHQIFSTACDKDMDKAINDAFLQSTGDIVFLFEGQQIPKVFEDKSSLNPIKQHHLNPEKNGAKEFLSLEVDQIPLLDTDLEKKDFYFNELEIPFSISSMGPVKCVKVISPALQAHFVDNWNEKYINTDALDLFKFPDFPHLIG